MKDAFGIASKVGLLVSEALRFAELEARRQGKAANEAYTPYEVRDASALLYLGWCDLALSHLAWLIEDQRPPVWRQWPEIAWRDARAPRFFGDLPHGWVASSFVLARATSLST